MDSRLKVPPINKAALTLPTDLANRLQPMIGHSFPLTGKSRTDGSNVRKLVAQTLLDYTLAEAAPEDTYEIVPPRKKGVPKILREFIDTYIITTGSTYNLQVWNRNPASDSVQIQYINGSVLSAKDVRFVFVQIDPKTEVISSIVILTPEYIESNFGIFGKPTIKHQLIIPNHKRYEIVSQTPSIFVGNDTKRVKDLEKNVYQKPNKLIHDFPEDDELFSIVTLANLLSPALLGKKIAPASTKNRGQSLELLVAQTLGYEITEKDILVGGYPDIRHQLLEVKIQDS